MPLTFWKELLLYRLRLQRTKSEWTGPARTRQRLGLGEIHRRDGRALPRITVVGLGCRRDRRPSVAARFVSGGDTARDVGCRPDQDALVDVGAGMASRELYRAALASLGEGVILQGPDSTILAANAAAPRILGLTLDQLMGRTSFDPEWRAVHRDGSPFPGKSDVIEIFAGWWYNSMALLADGWHMSSHAVAIGLSAVAYSTARRYSKDPRFAFGTWKVEILGRPALMVKQVVPEFLNARAVGSVLYASGEESEHQIKSRGDRLGVGPAGDGRLSGPRARLPHDLRHPHHLRIIVVSIGGCRGRLVAHPAGRCGQCLDATDADADLLPFGEGRVRGKQSTVRRDCWVGIYNNR